MVQEVILNENPVLDVAVQEEVQSIARGVARASVDDRFNERIDILSGRIDDVISKLKPFEELVYKMHKVLFNSNDIFDTNNLERLEDKLSDLKERLADIEAKASGD